MTAALDYVVPRIVALCVLVAVGLYLGHRLVLR